MCNFSTIVWLYRHSISCVLRGDGARLLVVVSVRNVTYTPNLKQPVICILHLVCM